MIKRNTHTKKKNAKPQRTPPPPRIFFVLFWLCWTWNKEREREREREKANRNENEMKKKNKNRKKGKDTGKSRTADGWTRWGSLDFYDSVITLDSIGCYWVFFFLEGGGGRHGTGSGKCSSATSTALPFHLNLYVLFLFTGLQRARVDFIFRRQSSKWEREHAVNERRDAGRLIVSFFFYDLMRGGMFFFKFFIIFF